MTEHYDWVAEQFKLSKEKEIQKRSIEKIKQTGTNKLFEKIIISSFKELTIEQLEDIRYYLNSEIRTRKILKRINEGEK